HLPPLSPLFPYTTLFRSDLQDISRSDGNQHITRIGWPDKSIRRFDANDFRNRGNIQQGRYPRQRALAEGASGRQDVTIIGCDGQDRKSTRLNSSHVKISY